MYFEIRETSLTCCLYKSSKAEIFGILRYSSKISAPKSFDPVKPLLDFV